jgi:hypothetical protein
MISRENIDKERNEERRNVLGAPDVPDIKNNKNKKRK